jgi:hypothetical protein
MNLDKTASIFIPDSDAWTWVQAVCVSECFSCKHTQ